MMACFRHAMRQKKYHHTNNKCETNHVCRIYTFLYVTYVLTYFSTLSMIKQVGEHNSQKYRQQIDIYNSL